jgi:hypothetical protein
MKRLSLFLIFLLSAVVFSCQDDEKQRQAETIRAARQNDSILKIISSHWKFDVPPPTPKVQMRISTWNEWQQFRSELAQKPTGGIGAYKQKTKNLVNKADQLRNNIPLMFNKPQVRARLGVLITKIKQMYTFLNLEVIQDKKVLQFIDEVTKETAAVQDQLDEIVRISEIPKEIGEEEMLRALDTTRMANPDRQPQPAQQIQPGQMPKLNVQPGVVPQAVPQPTSPQQREQFQQRIQQIRKNRTGETGNKQ